MSFILLNPGSLKPCYTRQFLQHLGKQFWIHLHVIVKIVAEKCEDGSHSTLPAMSLHSVLLEDKKCKKWNERAMGHAYNETLLGGFRIIRNPE
jgi:hypothetical protein